MTDNYSFTDRFVKLLAKHPYICAFAVCLFIHPFFLGAVENIPENALLTECILVLLSSVALLFCGYKKGKINKYAALGIMALIACAVPFLAKKYSASENRAVWHFAGGCVLTLAVMFISDRRKYRRQMFSFFILGTGFFLKLYYVLGTSVLVRQHDVQTFDCGEGHAGYITYLLTERHLPDFDVRVRFQFCHPPLSHICSAVWIWFNNNICGIDLNQSRESVQMLPLFYSMCIVISAYKIFRHFKLEGAALYVPLAVVSFHPQLTFYSGSINNDALAAALMAGSLVALLEWYEKPSYRGIIKLAFCIGFGMMTKLTAALVAPSTAVVFAIVLYKNLKSEWRTILRQFVVFIVICAPLGLWYGIRNMFWGVPLLYVQELPEGLLQNISGMPFKERITDFSLSQFNSVFEQWMYTTDDGYAGYNEHNPLIAIMKNSLFSEYINEGNFANMPGIIKTAKVFFWLSAVMALIAFVTMIISFFRKNKMDPVHKLFFGSFYFLNVIYLYKMAYDYTFTCTLNFRYIVLTVPVQMLFAGIMLDKLKTSKPKAYKIAKIPAGVLACTFAVLSTVVYLAVCYVIPE
ncbi:MAG: glycosyltransferase family 39 protein [Oscillospiraceae bacterium]|nr:glycosyltransferase family 39 protein [Oscillospiraceae bacterium]